MIQNGEHSCWRNLYNRLSQGAPEAIDDVDELSSRNLVGRILIDMIVPQSDIQVHDVAFHPPKIMINPSASRLGPCGSASSQKEP